MTAVKKICYTRLVQDMLEHYIHVLWEFNSLEAFNQKYNRIISLKMLKITELGGHEIIILHQQGCSQRQISKQTEYSRNSNPNR